MKKKTIAGLIVIVVIVTAVVFAGCIDKEQVNTYNKSYNKFGFSFDYPADMNIVAEEGGSPFREEANEESGVVYCKKPELAVIIDWTSMEEADESLLEKGLNAYFTGMSTWTQVDVGNIESRFLGDHMVIQKRFVRNVLHANPNKPTEIGIRGTWWCDKSKRIFAIVSVATWEDPAYVIGDSGKITIEWPNNKKDPSIKPYLTFLESFNCH
jgi:hypothetical protein